MAETPRHYGGLRETQRQVDEGLTHAAGQTQTTNAPRPIRELDEDALVALRAAYSESLQEKVGNGRIRGNDMTN